MTYLEVRDIIHKDVAARNILVGGDNRVKVSMYGVTRLIEESIYESTGMQAYISWYIGYH